MGIYSPAISSLNGHTETIKVLINAKADVEVKDQWEYTPLQLAALNGHTEALQAFISANANVEAR